VAKRLGTLVTVNIVLIVNGRILKNERDTLVKKKRNRMFRKKKTPYRKAKEKAWNTFSEYIRKRDCLQSTGSLERGFCCSCHRLVEYKNSQAGHFLDGRGNSILFEETGVHLQCSGCNIWKHGNKIAYYDFMRDIYGQEHIEKLKAQAKQTKTFTTSELIKLTEELKCKIKEIENV